MINCDYLRPRSIMFNNDYSGGTAAGREKRKHPVIYQIKLISSPDSPNFQWSILFII